MLLVVRGGRFRAKQGGYNPLSDGLPIRPVHEYEQDIHPDGAIQIPSGDARVRGRSESAGCIHDALSVLPECRPRAYQPLSVRYGQAELSPVRECLLFCLLSHVAIPRQGDKSASEKEDETPAQVNPAEVSPAGLQIAHARPYATEENRMNEMALAQASETCRRNKSTWLSRKNELAEAEREYQEVF